MKLNKLFSSLLLICVLGVSACTPPSDVDINNGTDTSLYTKSVLYACESYNDVSQQLFLYVKQGVITSKQLITIKPYAIKAGEFCSNDANYYIRDEETLKIVQTFLTEAQSLLNEDKLHD